MKANNWIGMITISSFSLALRGLANTWLDSQTTLEDIKGEQEKWSFIKPFSKAEFVVETDDKLILDG
jgi:hypothetical protein